VEKLLDRVVTVIFILALIAILYFVFKWVANQTTTGSITNNTEQVDDDDPFSDGDVDDILDNEDDDYYDEDMPAREDIPEEYDDEIASIMEDVVNEEEVEATAAAKAEKPITEKKLEKQSVKESTASAQEEKKVIQSSDSNTGKYLLVAGSFTSKENAEIHIKTLEKEGFTPEVVNFNNSRMHTVIASRYNTRAAADNAAAKMKAKKLECYVHIRR